MTSTPQHFFFRGDYLGSSTKLLPQGPLGDLPAYSVAMCCVCCGETYARRLLPDVPKMLKRTWIFRPGLCLKCGEKYASDSWSTVPGSFLETWTAQELLAELPRKVLEHEFECHLRHYDRSLLCSTLSSVL